VCRGLRETLEEPVFEHRLGAPAPLFGGLADADDRAAPGIAVRGQPAGRGDEMRHVHVVATRVHDAGDPAVRRFGADRRLVGEPCLLADGESVQIGAQHHGRALAVLDHADDAESADVAGDREPCTLEFVRDPGGRLHFTERELGILVQVLVEVRQGDHLGVEPAVPCAGRLGRQRSGKDESEGGRAHRGRLTDPSRRTLSPQRL
jgi:hypothetical protein